MQSSWEKIRLLSERVPQRLLFPILLLSAILRLAAMRGRVYLGDEVGTALAAEETYWHIMTHFSGWLTQPAYSMLAKLSSQIFWLGEFPIRLPSLIFGLGGIVAIYFLAARLFDERTGIIAALLLGLNPYHLFYSQMARSYAMAATLSILSFIWILRLVETRKVSDAVLYVSFTCLAIYSHLGCLGIVPGEALVALLVTYRRRGGNDWRKDLLPVAISIAAVGVLVLALYYPAMDDMLSYRRRFSGQSERGFSMGFVPLLLTAYMGGRGWSIYFFSLSAAVGLARSLRKDIAGALLIPTCAAGVLLFYFLNDSRVYPWAYTRFFFILLPVFVVAAAGGLVATAEAFAGRFKGTFKTATAPLCLMLSAFIFLTSTKIIEISFGEKDASWPDVITELEASFPPGALVTPMPIGSNSFGYYSTRAWPDKERVVTPGKIIKELKAGDSARTAKIPTVYIVDVVSFDDMDGYEGFAKSRAGSSTILYRRSWRKATTRERLDDLKMITETVTGYLEERDSEQIVSDWVYWRRGADNQKMFASRGALSVYYSLLAATQEKLGEKESAQYSRGKSLEWSRKIRMPEQVRSSWSMLLPHTDFLKIVGKYD